MSLHRLPFEFAHQMALLPILVLAALSFRGSRRDAAWWWLALAFFVSWLADTAADFLAPKDRWTVSLVYPVSQAALVLAVFLDRVEVRKVLLALVLVAIISVIWRGTLGPDVLLRTVAWGVVAGVVYERWALGRLRTALLVYFGLGLVSWLIYAFSPEWNSWLLYQAMRALGIGLFCAAIMKPGPALRLQTDD